MTTLAMTTNVFPFDRRRLYTVGTDTVVFAGTDVPIRRLFDLVSRGGTVDAFLAEHPSVGRERALEALRLAADILVAGARRG